MYPQGELNRVAARKALLRASLQTDRERCASAFERLTRPLVWLERLRTIWLKVSASFGIVWLFRRLIRF